jgi:primosomal protein N' (replication factor Y)
MKRVKRYVEKAEKIIGRRVKVEFGKRRIVGYVISCQEIEDKKELKLKRIIEVIDKDIVITKEAKELIYL